MHCPSCDRMMLKTGGREVEDEQGAMTITRWRCRPCHETTEEIWVRAGYGHAVPRRISYAVAASYERKTPARSFEGSRRGSPAHAVAG